MIAAWKTASKRGRPPGFNMEKYWRVLASLCEGPLSFKEVVGRSRLSRRFCWRVLRDGLARDVVGVNYAGHKAIYFLKFEGLFSNNLKITLLEDGSISQEYGEVKPSPLFLDWFYLGRPHISDFLQLIENNEEWEMMIAFEIGIFLYERYAHLKIADPRLYPEHYPRSLRGYEYGEVFRKMLKSRKSIEVKLPEEEIIINVCRVLLEKKLCPECFRRGELYLLDRNGDYFVCGRCGRSFKRPWANSKLYSELQRWRETGSRIKLGRITYYIGGRAHRLNSAT
jgi:ribosomal protein S27AE